MNMNKKIMYIIISSGLAIIFFNQLANFLSKDLGSLKGMAWAFLITGVILSLCSLLFGICYGYNVEEGKRKELSVENCLKR